MGSNDSISLSSLVKKYLYEKAIHFTRTDLDCTYYSQCAMEFLVGCWPKSGKL
jgi:hypothetical protein